MERSRDHDRIAAALAEARPAPRQAFVQELDQQAAGGFPRRSPVGSSPLAEFANWVRALSPQRLLVTGATAGLAVIAVTTVIVASNDSASERLALDSRPATENSHHVQPPASTSRATGAEATDIPSRPAGAGGYVGGLGANSKASSSTHGGSEVQSSPLIELPDRNASANLTPATTNLAPLSRRIHREIERSAEIGLLADPADLADDSAKVFAAVRDANGIVLHSSTSSGKNGGARFELLIPSVRLGDALAAFSSIDEVRSRHEATDDITKPTITTSEELQDTQARVDGLLAQLSGAEAESEREAIAAELHAERAHAARLRNQLSRLHQRTAYSRVLVRIQSGASTDSGGAWGVGDAFHDAGHILGIAAGVTLIGLAVITPLALLCLLAWLAQRLWLRSRRERALDA
jgi:hypothetical protein